MRMRLGPARTGRTCVDAPLDVSRDPATLSPLKFMLWLRDAPVPVVVVVAAPVPVGAGGAAPASAPVVDRVVAVVPAERVVPLVVVRFAGAAFALRDDEPEPAEVLDPLALEPVAVGDDVAEPDALACGVAPVERPVAVLLPLD